MTRASGSAPSAAVSSLTGKKVAHLSTVDQSLEYLLMAQLVGAMECGAAVVGISSTGPSVPRLERSGVQHIALAASGRGLSLRRDLRTALDFWRVVRRERPDVLHTHTPKPGIYGRILGRLAGVPVVVNTVHGLYATEDDPPLKRFLVYLIEAVAARCSDAELVQNEEDVALMRRLQLAPRRRLHHIGNGIDLDHFNPSNVSDGLRTELRSGLNVGPNDVLIGIVGRLEYVKGYRELIVAAEMLPEGMPIVAIGGLDPDKPNALTARDMERGRTAGIRFLGHREDVRDLYGAMDIVVLPSYREGIPRALMQGAAMAKPLIATDVRGCRQVVVDSVNGRLIPARDPESLASAIVELSSCSEKRKRWGLAGRRIAEERFDEAEVVRRVVYAYSQLLDGKPVDL